MLMWSCVQILQMPDNIGLDQVHVTGLEQGWLYNSITNLAPSLREHKVLRQKVYFSANVHLIAITAIQGTV